MSKLQSFEARHPQIAQWWTDSNFPFAVSLREQAAKKGALSEKQISAAMRCVEAFGKAIVDKQAREATAPVADVSGIAAAFQRAFDAGRKRVSLTIDGARIYPAKATGANPGALYVKDTDEGTYLGKFADGRFVRSRDCSDDRAHALVLIAINPENAAKEYGIRTGICCVCSRTLTDPESIALGIGPICAAKFGW